jgi:hypothetical protein
MRKMENEKIQWENVEIGKDEPQLKPTRVKIFEYEVKPVMTKEGKVIGDKLNFICKYPDKNESIDISGVSYLAKDKLKSTGLWLKLDNDKKIPFKSALAYLMRFYKVTSLKQLCGLEVDTVADENGYLLIKAY